jgi:hypothetical protein
LALGYVAFGCVAALAVLWGAAENRLFSDKHMVANFPVPVFGNLYLYHVWMGAFFGTVNAGAVCFVFPAFSVVGGLVWVWLMLWDVLVLDVVWWVIRYYHFKTNLAFALVLYAPEVNAWQDVRDWDNAPLFGRLIPLVQIGRFRCYWWWLVFAVVLGVLGAGLLVM